MKNNDEFKFYILILCSVIMYSLLITLSDIPIIVFNSKDILYGNNLLIYNIIYQIFAISCTLLFFVSWHKESYKKLIEQVKKYAIGLGAIVIYFLLSELQLIPFQLLNIDINKVPLYLKIIYLICYEAILIGLIILIHLKKIKKDIKDIKINHKKYFKECLKYWLIALFIMYTSNLAISFINAGLPTNEEIIRQQFEISPLYIYISAVIFAPILEELVFRQSIRNLFTKKWLFIIISGLVFGGMHVFTSGSVSFSEALYIIPYSVPGMAFAYMLYKTDNILVSTGFHTLHNGIMISLQFLLMYFL